MDRLIAALMFAVALFTAVPAPADQRDVAPADFADALAHAASGSTLRLAPGVYRGPYVVTVASLHVLGEPGAVIDGGGSGTPLTLAADGIEISGLTIRGSGDDLADNDAVVLIRDAHRVSVRHCRIEAKAFGIYLRGGGDHLIAGNEVRGDASLTRSKRGNGIHLWKTENNRVMENTLTDVRDGLYLSFAHHNLIEGNRATAVRFGIHYMYSNDNTLKNNRLENCVGGAVLMFARRNLIEGNRALANRRFGILLLSIDNSRLAGNLIARNDRGLVLENCNSDRFERNSITENGVGAFVTAGSDANLFASNTFDGNLVQAYVNHSGINLWSDHGRGNYWSDYAGFDFNGNGVGATPYHLQNATAALMATRPQARWFMMSPALSLLDWFQQRVVTPGDGFIDPAPLVTRAAR
ncbi:MAG TPA: nitrous oxide reductase family maturation protein NosD [Candidatus Acidoferrales bacterium]|nr:nitrous oxide reductase family maturation protein NosD [Candidatus Acidoferrales bacterium]